MITEASTGQVGYPQPRLRTDIVIGAPMRQGDSEVQYLKDPVTDWYYRLGAREIFLVTRLDGQRTRDEIDADYAAAFGRRLTAAHWDSLFAMLHSRRLLDGSAVANLASSAAPLANPNTSLTALRERARQERKASKRRLLLARFPLVNPDRFLKWLAPRVSALYSPWFVVPALLLALAALVVALTDLPALYAASRSNVGHPLALVAFGLTWLVIGLHEGAHGLTSRHFGGAVREMGLLWRFPLFTPYCKTDDVVVFSRRWHRVATAFAGVFVNLLVLIPFCAGWMFLAPGTHLHALVGSLLFYGTFAVVLNLIPVFRLDGYFMLTHAIGLADLRADTYRFWAALMRRTGTARYSRGDRIAYGTYGLVVFGTLFVIVAGIVSFWFWSLDRLIGPFGAAAVLSAEAVLVALGIGYLIRRRKRRAAQSAVQSRDDTTAAVQSRDETTALAETGVPK